PRHFYEMHSGRNAAYRIVDPPTLPGDGPWEVWDRAEEIAIVDPYGEPVASCQRTNILDEQVVRARLRLAADAPALLAALRDVLDEADSDEVHDHERTGCDGCAFCRAKALAARHGH
ncbi:MAG TPA: hypothetical protein VD866_28495, partial [Urbifossiella sp.]|nr:hypothetical protein [Urbifossiella sp.]